jgi:hypothetical protein
MESLRSPHSWALGEHNGLPSMNFINRVIFGLYLAVYIIACTSHAGNESSITEVTPKQIIECTEPRPQICTREYMPVCATKDTGTRCVTTPCPATKKVTYATGCTACADPMVLGYMPGECES